MPKPAQPFGRLKLLWNEQMLRHQLTRLGNCRWKRKNTTCLLCNFKMLYLIQIISPQNLPPATSPRMKALAVSTENPLPPPSEAKEKLSFYNFNLL